MQHPESMVRGRETTTHVDWRDAAVLLTLAVTVAVVFHGVTRHAFLLYDDDVYVTSNATVQHGLTWQGVQWSLETTQAANWHPVTWLSHMMDCQWYGLDPWGHHLTSLVLHILNVCLVFFLLRWTTGRRWSSALAAALFGLHPLRVESVAWIAERKDVLSAFFGLLTVAAYVWYTQRPRARWRYALVAVLFTLALMSKPMLVSLPFALLLIDWWPLERFRLGNRSDTSRAPGVTRLLVEKVPLLALAVGSSFATLYAQRLGGAVSYLDALPLRVRFENAIVGCGQYLGRTIWPRDLSFLYPHSLSPLPFERVVMTAALLCVVSVVAFFVARRLRFVPVGWFWFLGSLVPTLGFVQVGLQATADRYTYWPHIGLAMLVAWSAAEIATRLRLPLVFRIAIGVAVVGALSITTWRQVSVWHDTLTLTQHALAVDPANSIAMTVRAQTLAAEGRYAEAIDMYQAALNTQTPLAEAHAAETKSLLSAALLSVGDINDAARVAAEAVAEKPGLAMAHFTLGRARMQQKRFDEARAELERSLRIDPLQAAAHSDLANVLLEQRDFSAAIEHGQRAVDLSSDLVAAHYNLGRALVAVGEIASGLGHLQAGLSEGSQWPLVARELAWIRATCALPQFRDAEAAVRLAEEADRRTRHRMPKFLDTLAAAYAEAQRWPRAVATAELAIRTAIDQDQTENLAKMRQRLASYREGRPWREDTKR